MIDIVGAKTKNLRIPLRSRAGVKFSENLVNEIIEDVGFSK